MRRAIRARISRRHRTPFIGEALEDRCLLSAVSDSFVIDTTNAWTQHTTVPQHQHLREHAVTFSNRDYYRSAATNDERQSQHFIPIDTAKQYVLSGFAKSGDEFGQRFDPANEQSFGLQAHDADNLPIEPQHVLRYPTAVDTTLAAPLSPGDNIIQLTDASGWSTDSVLTRAMAWYGYTNSAGTIYEDYSYTRFVAGTPDAPLWSRDGIDFASNAITLSEPWSGPSLPMGTSVRNATAQDSSSSTVLNNSTVPGDFSWSYHSASFTGTYENGSSQPHQLPPATASVKVRLRMNTGGTTNNLITWRNIRINEVADGTEADLAPPIVDLSDIDAGHESVLTLTPPNRLESISRQNFDLGWGRELVRVNPDERYTLTSSQFISFDNVADDSERETYDLRRTWMASFDVDQKFIHPLHVSRHAGSADTRLSADLNPGDTSFVVKNASGWSNDFGSARTRSLAWFGYEDSTGHVYPDYTYTRNVAFDYDSGLWEPGAIVAEGSNFRVTLREPWDGPVVVAGTAVRNATAEGDVYNDLLDQEDRDRLLPLNHTVGGVWDDGVREENRFRPGTAYVQFLSRFPVHNFRMVPERSALATKFSEATFDQQAVATVGYSLAELTSDELLPIVADRTYELSVDVELGETRDDDSESLETHSLGFAAFDADQLEIRPEHVTRFEHAVDTRLSQSLTAGDTEIHLDDATGWSNHIAPGDTRGLAWFGYENSFGETYDDYTYTRNVATDGVKGLWDAGAIDGNVITLREPWSGPTLAVGSAVRNASGGARFINSVLNGQSLPEGQHRAEVTGTWQDGLRNEFAFPPATAYIRQAARLNESALLDDDIVTLSNFIVRELRASHNTEVVDGDTVAYQLDVLANDFAGSELVSVEAPHFGTAEITTTNFEVSPQIDSTHVILYTPTEWFVGTDKLTYTVRDGDGIETTASVRVSIASGNYEQNVSISEALETQGNALAGNDVPSTTGIYTRANAYSVPAGTTLEVPASLSGLLSTLDDDSGDEFIVKLVSGAEYGVLELHYDGSFTYTPDDGFVGVDGFRFAVFDGVHTSEDTISIQVVESAAEQTAAQLERIATAFHYSHDVFKRFVRGEDEHYDEDGRLLVSWRVHLLPFLGRQELIELYHQFRLDEPWDSEHNLPLSQKMPEVYRSVGDDPLTTDTRFQVVDNRSGEYFWDADSRSKRFRDVLDGNFNTTMLLQVGGDKAVPWTSPDDLTIDQVNLVESLGDIEDQVLHTASYAGAAQSFDLSITESETLHGLLTAHGGELIDGIAESLRTVQYQAGPAAVRDAREEREDEYLRWIGNGFHNFHDVHGYFGHANQSPTSTTYYDEDGKPWLSWRVHLLPFLGYGWLWEEFNQGEPWDSPHNIELLQYMPEFYRSFGDSVDSTTTRLKTFEGVGAPFNHEGTNQPPSAQDFRDGTTNTILVAEVGEDEAIEWTRPDAEIPFDPANPLVGLGGLRGRLRTLFADGEYHEFGADTSADSLKGMITHTGREVVNGRSAADRDRERSNHREGFRDTRMKLQYLGLTTNHIDGPDRYFDPDTGIPLLSWRVHLLRELGEWELYTQFNLDEPWDSEHNIQLIDKMPDWFRSVGDPFDSTTTRVQTFFGPGAPFLNEPGPHPQRGPEFQDIRDGRSTTIHVVEAGPDQAVTWTRPDDIQFDPADPWAALGHVDIELSLAFFDGSVGAISTQTRDELLTAMVTHDSGDFNPFEYGLVATETHGQTIVSSTRLDTIAVVLPEQASGLDEVTVSLSDSTIARIDSTTLSFTEAGQVLYVTIAGIDEDHLIGDCETIQLEIQRDGYPAKVIDVLVVDVDYPGATISPGGLSLEEGGADGEYSVELSTEISGPVTVRVEPNTEQVQLSTDGVNFGPTVDVLFSDRSAQTVFVRPNDDAVVEATKVTTLSHTVISSGDPHYVSLPLPSLDVTIEDDDEAIVSVAGTSQLEGNSGTTSLQFEVTLDSAVEAPVVVYLQTTETDATTATPSEDYEPNSGLSVTFEPASDAQTLTVEVIVFGDTVFEADETFSVEIVEVVATDLNVTTGLLAESAIGTIENDDTVAYIDGDDLIINGTPDDDTVQLSETGETLTVEVNSQQFEFSTDDYSQIRIGMQSGDDSVIATSVTTPMRVGLGSGDDLFEGGSAADYVTGSSGRDTLFGNEGSNTLSGGLGIDLIKGGSAFDRIKGGNGADTLMGEGGDDIITAGGGKDSVLGGPGNDRLGGGNKSDRLEGGDGDDSLFGGDGSDRLYGNDGDDLLVGQNGRVEIGGGNGNDTLIGGSTGDKLSGGSGNDLIDGQSGEDRINGGSDRDVIVGGEGADNITALASDDLVLSGTTNLTVEHLTQILAEWSSDRSYDQRVANVIGTGERSNDRLNSQFLAGADSVQPQTAFDDSEVNSLTGEGGRDLFFASVDDLLADRRDDEWLEML